VSWEPVPVHGAWQRPWTFIAAVAATVIGLGNVWKFSWLAGQHGGGGFVLAYLLCLLLVALPLLIAELVLGARGRADPVHAMATLQVEVPAGRGWLALGWLAGLAALLVLAYLSVVAAWLLDYVTALAGGRLEAVSGRQAGQHFAELLADPRRQLMWHGIFLLTAAVVVALGVRRGLGALARLLVPVLIALLLGLVHYAWRYGDMAAGLRFLFELRREQIHADMLLAALGQAFFSLGIGMGAMMTYGAYAPRRHSLVAMTAAVAGLDVLVALLAGLAIFPLVFSLHVEPNYGPGLMFVTLPYAFGNTPYGMLAGTAFFVLMGLITLGTAVALLEPGTAWLVQRLGWRRPLAALVLAALSWLPGVLVIGNLSWWPEASWQGRNLLGWLDAVTAHLLLPLVGVMIALFAGWRLRAEVARDELFQSRPWVVGLWRLLLRWLVLPAVVAVLVTGLYSLGWG